jgi:hypothetical protein
VIAASLVRQLRLLQSRFLIFVLLSSEERKISSTSSLKSSWYDLRTFLGHPVHKVRRSDNQLNGRAQNSGAHFHVAGVGETALQISGFLMQTRSKVDSSFWSNMQGQAGRTLLVYLADQD